MDMDGAIQETNRNDASAESLAIGTPAGIKRNEAMRIYKIK